MARPFSNNRHRRSHKTDNNKVRMTIAYSRFGQTWSLDAFAEEMSEQSPDWHPYENESGGYWLLEGPFRFRAGEVESYEFGRMNRAERRAIKRYAGAIVNISTSGFVNVDWYEDDKTLKTAWNRVENFFAEREDE